MQYRDGKKNSLNNWKYFETVRYKDCNGSLYHPNRNCFYPQEYTRENFMHFDEKGNCDMCGANGIFNACEAGKYIAFKRNALVK